MKNVTVLDKEFSLSVTSKEIQANISRIASKLNNDLKGKDPIFIAILNGAFIFASDLYKQITVDSRITFIKYESYEGTQTTGTINELIGLSENVKGKTLVILEDIIDTGNTIEKLIAVLGKYEPEEIKIVTLIFKPESYKKEIAINYVGMEIPNDFIVGYGLDYNGYGRNLPDIYTLV